jgi:hypothetical protein
MNAELGYMLQRMNRTAANFGNVGKNSEAAVLCSIAIAGIISPIMGGGAT